MTVLEVAVYFLYLVPTMVLFLRPVGAPRNQVADDQAPTRAVVETADAAS